MSNLSSQENATADYFAHLPNISYEGEASKNVFCYKYYNAEEVILGKKMKDWLRFSVCYWHTFRGDGRDMFGAPTLCRPWVNNTFFEANIYEG